MFTHKNEFEIFKKGIIHWKKRKNKKKCQNIKRSFWKSITSNQIQNF